MNRFFHTSRLSIVAGIATLAASVIVGFSSAPPVAAQAGNWATYGTLVYPKGVTSCPSPTVGVDADYRNAAVNGNAAQGWDVTISQGYFNSQLGWIFIGADIDTDGTVHETDPSFLHVTFNDGLWHRFRCNRDFFGGYEVDFESVDKFVEEGVVFQRTGSALVEFVASSDVRAMRKVECQGFNTSCTTSLPLSVGPNSFVSGNFNFRSN